MRCCPRWCRWPRRTAPTIRCCSIASRRCRTRSCTSTTAPTTCSSTTTARSSSIDWQSISIGGGSADVGYFLGQNLAIADLRAHEDDLLHRYHDTLVAEGVTGYEYDQFFDDYRMAVLYGWVIPVFAVGSLDTSSERAMALWTAVLERIQDAIFHHNAQEFIA